MEVKQKEVVEETFSGKEDLSREETERRKKLFQAYLHSDEYQKKLIQRLKINDACNNKAEARTVTWQLCARPDNPAEGCIFFIENFGWTFDPRPQSAPGHLPFILFEFQKNLIRELIDHIDNGRDYFIEKSRDMGASWLIFAMVPLWYWIFGDGVNMLLGSYKEKLVDDRTKDSLFGLIDYAVDNLPLWLLPRGYNKDKHRNHLKLVNPANFNLIAGESMSGDFGRGMRKTAVFFDELGSWDYAMDAWESCADVTACRVANSTPKGQNFYAELRESGIDILTLKWVDHPMKDSMWYEAEKARRTEESLAQEVDISYNKSLEGRVYAEWNELNVGFGDFEYNPELPLYVSWDYGKTDDTAIIWAQKEHGRLRIVDTYRNTNKNIDFYIPLITGIMPSEGYQYTKKDLELIHDHRHWARGTHFGDPSGRFRNQVTNNTVFTILQESGITVNFFDSWKEFEKRKTAGKLLIMKGIDINLNERTKYFNRCMSQAGYPIVKRAGMPEVRSEKPNHDWTAHYRSSFEYLALGLAEFNVVRKKPYDKFPQMNRGRRAIAY